MKKSRPFVLHSKEHDKAHRRFTRRLFSVIILSSFILPLLINGVLSYIHEYNIAANSDFFVIDKLLQIFIKVIPTAVQFVSYAVLALCAYRLSKRIRRTCFAIIALGTVFTYAIIEYIVSCLVNGLVIFDFSDYDSFSAFLYCFFCTVLLIVKVAVLLTIALKRIKKYANDAHISPPDTSKKLFACAFNFDGVYFRLSLLFFSLSLAIDILINFLNAAFNIILDGWPENLDHYVYLLEPIGFVIIQNCVGLVVMAIVCVLLDKAHTSYRDEQQMKNFINN